MTKRTGRKLARNVRAIMAAASAADKRIDYSIKDTRGLILRVRPTGRKSWGVRYYIDQGGKRKRAYSHLGEFPMVSLADAVVKATTIMHTVAEGDDPAPDVAPETLNDLFDHWLTTHAKKHLRTWEADRKRYRRHLSPALGASPFAEIERRDVSLLRDQVAVKSGDTESNAVLNLFQRIVNFAVDSGLVKFNPAIRMRKIGKATRRERVLAIEDMPRFWAALDAPVEVEWSKKREASDKAGDAPARGGLTAADRKAARITRRALKLLLLTGQRRNEVAGMKWSELDVEDPDDIWWTIPAERCKNNLEHRVPICRTAYEVVLKCQSALNFDPLSACNFDPS